MKTDGSATSILTRMASISMAFLTSAEQTDASDSACPRLVAASVKRSASSTRVAMRPRLDRCGELAPVSDGVGAVEACYSFLEDGCG